ncbi:hypothetical protein [Photorhabdus luminescens]|uniref:hypothetical protein n=1 Tax=Photorhabdus luminescens TaxID=29488 RepID=UPI003BB69158
MEIIREGDTIIFQPAKPSWNSFLQQEKADFDFLIGRLDIVEEGRVKLRKNISHCFNRCF